MTKHRWDRLLGRLPWLVCVGCGLVNLKNEATRLLIRQGCGDD